MYELAALLKLVWIHRTYSGGDIFSAITFVKSAQGTAVDVGAHRGESALRIARLKPGWRIVSFEPNKDCEFFLRRVQAMLGSAFSFHLVGLASRTGAMTYYEPCVGAIPVRAEGTFFPQNLEGPAKARLGNRFKIHKREFPVRRMDEMNLAPDFVKIDVQGGELDVLRGAAETLRRFKPLLVIERNKTNECDVKSYLAELGYRVMDHETAIGLRISAAELGGDNIFLSESSATL